MIKNDAYLAALKERGKKSRSRVSTRHQMIGLIVAELLEDRPHKSLYIKLAKQGDEGRLMELARDVSERGPVQNKGAYFMTILENEGFLKRALTKPKKRPVGVTKTVKKKATKKTK